MRNRIRLSDMIKGFAVAGAIMLLILIVIEGNRLCAAGRIEDALILVCLGTPILSLGFFFFFAGLGEIVEKICSAARERFNDKDEL